MHIVAVDDRVPSVEIVRDRGILAWMRQRRGRKKVYYTPTFIRVESLPLAGVVGESEALVVVAMDFPPTNPGWMVMTNEDKALVHLQSKYPDKCQPELALLTLDYKTWQLLFVMANNTEGSFEHN